MRKKLLISIFLVLIFSIPLADVPYACQGSMRIKVNLQNSTEIYGYTTLHAWDIYNFSALGIEGPRQIYKLIPGTDILPYLSEKITIRYFTSEIFYIPEEMGIVPEDKLQLLSSLGNIKSIEFIDWMDYRACNSSGFISLPAKDIKYLRENSPIWITTNQSGEFPTTWTYVSAGHNMQGQLKLIIYKYAYSEILDKDLQNSNPDKDELMEYYNTLFSMWNYEISISQLETYKILEYFQYIKKHIEIDILHTAEDEDFTFNEKVLKDLFDQVLVDNNIFLFYNTWE